MNAALRCRCHLWLALFIGNAFSRVLLGWVVVPPLSRVFGWIEPPAEHAVPARRWITWRGTALVPGLYATLLLFSHLL